MADTTLRKDADKMNADEIAALRGGYAKMMGLSGTDNRSWIYWGGQHGFPNYYCWHHGRVGSGNRPQPYNLFLPWHRAYLLYFEHTVRDQNPAANLPWWDWTNAESQQHGVPAIFSAPTLDGGALNPLASGPVPAIQDQPARQTRRFPGDPSGLPTAAEVEAVLSLDNFLDFTTQIEDLHDQVHGWAGGQDPNDPTVGGDMGNIGVAAFDPLFWSHHAMIDRLWYLWQARHGNDSIPQSYLHRALAPFALTVQDVLDVEHLGYDYAVSSVATPAQGGGA